MLEKTDQEFEKLTQRCQKRLKVLDHELSFEQHWQHMTFKNLGDSNKFQSCAF